MQHEVDHEKDEFKTAQNLEALQLDKPSAAVI